MDVVRAYKRKKNVWGIEGYDLPKFNAYLDKVRNVRIVKDQKKNYLDDLEKMKANIPAPCTYNIEGSLINPKRNSSLSKGKRLTLVDEIIRENTKNLKPGPGQYKDQTKVKYLGAFNLKETKSPGFIDDAQYLSL